MNYRILFKALVNHLKSLLNHLISKKQYVFIANNSIYDNILMALEIVYSMHCSRSKNPFILVKIDLEKTYDKFSWNVVIKILDSLNTSLGRCTHISPPLPLHAYLMQSLSIGLRAVEISRKGTQYHPTYLSLFLSSYPFS